MIAYQMKNALLYFYLTDIIQIISSLLTSIINFYSKKQIRENPLYFYSSPYPLQKYALRKIRKAKDQITMTLLK